MENYPKTIVTILVCFGIVFLIAFGSLFAFCNNFSRIFNLKNIYFYYTLSNFDSERIYRQITTQKSTKSRFKTHPNHDKKINQITMKKSTKSQWKNQQNHYPKINKINQGTALYLCINFYAFINSCAFLHLPGR